MDSTEDLDMEYFFSGVKNDLEKANLVLESRVYPDILISGLDKLLEGKKEISSNKFNRSLFSHILDFKELSTANTPILVSDFFNSYFHVYESMRCNRESNGRKCLEISNNITQLKDSIVKHKQTEKNLEDGRTTNSMMRIEIRDIQVYSDLNLTADVAFKGKTIDIRFDDSTQTLISIPIDNEGIQNTYQFDVSNINRAISVFLVDKNSQLKLDTYYPRDAYDEDIERICEIVEKGKIIFDVVYINSQIDYMNKLINKSELEYEECHVHFDNLNDGVVLLEQPFQAFMDRHNNDPERRVHTENNPASLDKTDKQSYLAHLNRKEIEVSEKMENLLLNVMGKKHIVWESIYYLLNKVLIGLVVISLLSRGDYASLLLGIIGLGFEFNNIHNRKFGTMIFFMTLTLVFDFFWLIIGFSDWSEVSPLEGTRLAGIRRIAIFSSFLVFLIKIILCFSGWRLYIIYKMKDVNVLNLPNNRKTFNARALAEPKQNKKKPGRPTISYSKNLKENHSLRFLDGGII